MEINPTTTTGAAGTPKAGASEAAGSGTAAGAVTGDFQTFLTLLTTQMRNQDPLKPMDSTEFVAQLASFSAVEQQIRSNERLQGILDVLSGGSPAGLAEWIGREVRVAAKADFAGAPVEVAVEPAEGADKAVLVVENDFGNEVARLAVAADATEVTWDGKDAMGATVGAGELWVHARELRRRHADRHERGQGLPPGAGGARGGRRAGAGGGRRRAGAARRGRRGALTPPPRAAQLRRRHFFGGGRSGGGSAIQPWMTSSSASVMRTPRLG